MCWHRDSPVRTCKSQAKYLTFVYFGTKLARWYLHVIYVSSISWCGSGEEVEERNRRLAGVFESESSIWLWQPKVFVCYTSVDPLRPASLVGRSHSACGPEVSARYRHDPVHHGAHGRRRPHPAVPLQFTSRSHHWVHRDLPEPTVHWEQRSAHIPGSDLLDMSNLC